MKPGDIRIGKKNLGGTWLNGKCFMIYDLIEVPAGSGVRVAVVLMSNGRLTRDTFDFIKKYSVPIEE